VPCDADGDGDFDLIVSCPDKPSNGVYLFENPSQDPHQKMPVFKPARRISPALRYVTPCYVQSGLRVLSEEGELLNFVKTGTLERQPLPVNMKFYKPSGKAPRGPKLRHKQWSLADYDGDTRLDIIAAMEDWSYYGWDDAYDASGAWQNGALRGFVFVFRNLGDERYAEPFQIHAGAAPLETYGCPSPNFFLADADDDLDLLCGEFLDGFTYYQNTGTSSEPRYAAGERVLDAQGRQVRMDLEMIVPVAIDWDRDGDADFIVGDEDGRVALVENTGGKRPAGQAPRFAQPAYFRQEADRLKCGALATPYGVDWDADGDWDIVSGNSAGYLEFFENLSGKGHPDPKWAAPVRLLAGGKVFRIMAGPNGSIQGPAEAKWGYTTHTVADWDADGLLDIVCNSILGDVIWLKNTGTRQKPVLAAPEAIQVEWKGAPPELKWGWRKPKGQNLLTQWRTTPVVHDFNTDGRMDLAMLDTEGYLAFFERGSDMRLLAPRRAFLDEQGHPLRLNAEHAGRSGRRKLCAVDWDRDGRMDLLLNSSNADFYRQISADVSTWRFQKVGTLTQKNIEGHDVSPSAVDFDDDGKMDFLGGAEDGRFYFLKNPH
jgi:hypothetical protein